LKSAVYGDTVQQGVEMCSLKDSLWDPESDKPEGVPNSICCFRTMNPAQYWIAAKKDSLQICIFVAMN
jgi:hypothetical protein